MNNLGNVAVKKQLLDIIEQIERFQEEKQSIQDDIKDCFSSAKSQGFDVPAIRQVIKLRKINKKNPEDLKSHELLRELYKDAVGIESHYLTGFEPTQED